MKSGVAIYIPALITLIAFALTFSASPIIERSIGHWRLGPVGGDGAIAHATPAKGIGLSFSVSDPADEPDLAPQQGTISNYPTGDAICEMADARELKQIQVVSSASNGLEPSSSASAVDEVKLIVVSNELTASGRIGNPPAVTLNPDDLEITYGADATFTAAATGDPAPTVQWQARVDGVTWTNIAGATEETLTVSNPRVVDSGNCFRAVFTNVHGAVITESSRLTVNERELTIRGSFTVEDKTYDGTPNATVRSQDLELFTVVEDDDVELASIEARFTQKNAGIDIEVQILEAHISGEAADNYVLSSTGAPTTTADITSKELVIVARDQIKFHGDEFVFDGTEIDVIGIVNGEAITKASLTSHGADASAPIGTYRINVYGALADPSTQLANYSIDYIPGTLTVLPSASLTTEDYFHFDVNGDPEDGQQFRLILTPDYRAWTDGSVYRLPASNPGQFRYNALFYSGGEAMIEIDVPFPFVTPAVDAVQVFDGIDPTWDEETGEFLYVPGRELATASVQVLLDDYDVRNFGELQTVQVAVEHEGLVLLSIRLNYGLKGTTGWAQKQVADDRSPIAYEYDSELGGLAEDSLQIVNGQRYQFAHRVDGKGGTQLKVFSLNEFKRNTGIGGLLSCTNNEPMAGAIIRILQLTSTTGRRESLRNFTELAVVGTDEDGWYLWPHQWRGRPTKLRVEMYIPQGHAGTGDPFYTTDVTVRAMGYYQVDYGDSNEP